jgi:acyl-homoserine lactone acylase PvdQ
MSIRPVLCASLVALGILLSAQVAAAAEKVTIVRDSRGEPHIEAKTAAGATYGLGYAQM